MGNQFAKFLNIIESETSGHDVQNAVSPRFDQRLRRTKMKTLHDYVDICLIDEYADKDFENGYSLDVDSLSEHERSNFLDELMKHDTTVRDLVLHHMQKLIDERLPECEVKDRQNAGLKLIRLSNGDTRIVPEGRYY